MVKKEAVQNSTDNSFGVGGVVLGIVAILFSLLIPLFGIVLGIIAGVFGFKQSKVYRNPWSTWGMVISILGIVLSAVLWIISIYYL